MNALTVLSLLLCLKSTWSWLWSGGEGFSLYDFRRGEERWRVGAAWGRLTVDNLPQRQFDGRAYEDAVTRWNEDAPAREARAAGLAKARRDAEGAYQAALRAGSGDGVVAEREAVLDAAVRAEWDNDARDRSAWPVPRNTPLVVRSAPWWPFIAGFAALPGWRTWARRRRRRERRRRFREGLCVECGYALMDNVSGTCPECGTRTGER